MKKEPLREEDMDVVGALFAIKFIECCGENGCAELYIEDDGWYHPSIRFSRFWLRDLSFVAEKASKAVKP